MRRGLGVSALASVVLCVQLGACAGSSVTPPPAALPASTASASASASTSASPPSAETTTVDDDTTITTATGSTFVAPRGWTVTKGTAVVLQDPDREVSVTYVERMEADGAEAIAAAWRQVRPDFAYPVKRAKPWPGNSGWDAETFVEYTLPPSLGRKVWASATRKGDTWSVTLVDGTESALERRQAQVDLTTDSFRAKGVVPETFEGRKAQVLDAGRLAKLEAFLERARKTWAIPGMAVAVLQNGKVVFEKAFGVKEIGKTDPVTVRTRFRISSMTKPLTSLLIASLVADGKLGWDSRMTELYPGFALGDAELTKRLTMRDMLCACTGIPRDEIGLLFESKGVTGEQMIERMKMLSPTTRFGETHQYSNPMVAAAGYAAARVAEPKRPVADGYVKLMQERVLGPLGMTSTTFDARVALRGDHASPHVRDVGFQRIPLGFDGASWMTPMNPAGGAWSTVGDMARVLAMELSGGKGPKGERLFAEGPLMARREPQSRAGENERYGLALDVEVVHVIRVFGHGGGLPGYTSFMFFLPDHGVAAVLFANVNQPHPVLGFARRRLLELLFDGKEEAKHFMEPLLQNRREIHEREVSRIDFTPGRAFFEPFLGVYRHALYGTIAVRRAGDGAVLDVGEWKASLGRVRDDDGVEHLVGTTPPFLGWPSLVRKEAAGSGGKARKVSLEMRDEQRSVVFERN